MTMLTMIMTLSLMVIDVFENKLFKYLTSGRAGNRQAVASSNQINHPPWPTKTKTDSSMMMMMVMMILKGMVIVMIHDFQPLKILLSSITCVCICVACI